MSSSTPLVSILVTVYNRDKYLAQCINSVLSSTFEDWELLIVDDGSKDNSVSIAKEFEQKDSRIHLHINKKNLGQFENRNHAASLAKGKYIKYLDSDDTIYPHGLEVMVKTIEAYPDAGAAISHDRLHEEEPYPIRLKSNQAYEAFYFNKGFPNSGPSASIINRKIFNQIGGFPKPYYVGTDSLLWLEIASVSEIIKMAPALNWYRIHDGQAITGGIQNNEYLQKDYNYVLKYLKIPKCKLSDKQISKAKQLLKKRQLRNLLLLGLKKRKPIEAYRILKYNNLKLIDLLKAF
jgi:glycosyltransferase involved in cell wall biosynthesis